MAQLNQLDCGKRVQESVFLPTSKVVLKALKTGATDPRSDPFKKKFKQIYKMRPISCKKKQKMNALTKGKQKKMSQMGGN